MITPHTARLCWAVGQWPALDRLQREGRLESVRAELVAIAHDDLTRANPDGTCRMVDHCHALELAAEKILARETIN